MVAENGAIVYNPHNREEVRLGNPPSKLLIQGLRARGVDPLEIGEVLVATHAAHRTAVQDVLAEIGWAGRQGIGDSGNQFHYYRLTPDNRILWGGYDAVYASGGYVQFCRWCGDNTGSNSASPARNI